MKRGLDMIMNVKRKWKALSAAAVAIGICVTMLSGPLVAFAAPGKETLIGLERAKEIVLADAGLDEKDVTFIKAKLDRDDGNYEYDIEFYSGKVEYDYEIDAVTGRILENDRDIEYYDIPDSGSANVPSGVSDDFIGEMKAKSIALEHAGVKESDATFVKTKLDYDDGHTVYDVEFYSGKIEYDYEIDAVSGKIWSYDHDAKNHSTSAETSSSSNQSASYIKETKAKSIALTHAGLRETGVSFSKVKLDREDGRAVYEVEFHSGTTEYEYEIDAETGNILEWDIDYDD